MKEQSLMGQIGVVSHQQLDSHLRKLAHTSTEQLYKAFAERDGQDRTPLHWVVEQGDIEKTKVLLSFDASIDTQMSGKNVEVYAKELVDKNPQDLNRRHVYALIKSRGRWQRAGEKREKISFSRAIRAVEDAINNIQGADGKTGVLFFGITGEGKSTAINHLTGVDYKFEGVRRKAQLKVASGVEQAQTGASTTSETLYPQVITLKQQSYVLVDLPGFEDTRGTSEEVCAATSVCMLTKQLRSIQAILMVCSWGTLEDSRMTNYRRAACYVGGMIHANPGLAQNVILVVSKPPEDLDESEVRERLEKLVEDQGWTTTIKETRREDVDDDTWKKYCLRKATEAVLSRQKGSIVIMDVTKPEARTNFQKAIETSGVAKPPQEFDFKSYSQYMVHFQMVMEQMILNHNELRRMLDSIKEKKENLSKSIRQVEEEKKELLSSIEKYEKQKTEPFTEATFDQSIQEEKQKIKDLRLRINEQNELLRRAERDLGIKAAKLDNLDHDGEKLIDVVHQGWTCEKTEDRVEKELEEIGAPVCVPGFGRMQPVRLKETRIPGVEKTVSEPVKYPSVIPIKRFVDRSIGGTFTPTGFTPGDKELRGMFTSTPGARGGVSLSVELYGDLKDFPSTQDKLKQCESDMKNAEEALNNAKNGCVSEDDYQEVLENLRKMELEKISAQGNHTRTREICDMRIEFFKGKLDEANKRLDELNRELNPLEPEAQDLSCQLEVNGDLFFKIRQIVQTIGLTSPIIHEFMKMFSGTSASVQPMSDATSSIRLVA